MTATCRSSIVCCIAIYLATVGAACAQPLMFRATSVEWHSATAQVIVRGVIDKIDLHKRQDDYVFYTVTFRVLETLKGKPVESLQFVCDRDLGSLREPLALKQELMLFLDDWKRAPYFDRLSGDHPYSRFPLRVQEAINLSPDQLDVRLPALSHDLTRLTTPALLEGAIRRYLDGHRRGELVRAEVISQPDKVASTFGSTDMTLKRPRAEPRVEIIDFDTFKARFGREPPAEWKSPYTRAGNKGDVGVSALELMAADCDAIVRGVVRDWCFVTATKDPTGPICGVRLEVIEAFKGGRMGHVDFVMHDARDLAKLQADRQELIVFLRERGLDMPAAALGYETRAGLWDDAVIVCDERAAEVLLADMTWHRNPDEILKRLRTVIERDDVGNMDPEFLRLASQGHTGPPMFDFHPPASLTAGSSIEGNHWSVAYLPIDTHLEANARRWAKSDNKDLRWLAARALVYFKSDENATILRALLDDTATWKRREMLAMLQGDGQGYEMYRLNERSPLVHWEAWHVLCGWGYDVPKLKFGE